MPKSTKEFVDERITEQAHEAMILDIAQEQAQEQDTATEPTEAAVETVEQLHQIKDEFPTHKIETLESFDGVNHESHKLSEYRPVIIQNVSVAELHVTHAQVEVSEESSSTNFEVPAEVAVTDILFAEEEIVPVFSNQFEDEHIDDDILTLGVEGHEPELHELYSTCLTELHDEIFSVHEAIASDEEQAVAVSFAGLELVESDAANEDAQPFIEYIREYVESQEFEDPELAQEIPALFEMMEQTTKQIMALQSIEVMYSEQVEELFVQLEVVSRRFLECLGQNADDQTVRQLVQMLLEDKLYTTKSDETSHDLFDEGTHERKRFSMDDLGYLTHQVNMLFVQLGHFAVTAP